MEVTKVIYRLSGREPILRDPLLLYHTAGEADSGTTTLDMSDLRYVSPMDLVSIAAWADLFPSSMNRVVRLPPEVIATYLERMNLLSILRRKGWQIQSVSTGPRDRLPHRLLELTPLADAWEVEELANQLPALFATETSSKRRVRALHFAFGELCDNATSHSEASPVFVAAQRYSGATSGYGPRLELAIADSGIGVQAHLRRRGRFATIANDADALLHASRPGVTGVEDERGYGFSDVLHAINEAGRGEMIIQSGQAQAHIALGFDHNQRNFQPLDAPIAGTRILVRVYED